MAVCIGVVGAFVALILTRLIGFFTNLFYYQRFAIGEMTSPAGHHLGVWSVFIPIIGGLIIGLMARFGSEKIRGHGIPDTRLRMAFRSSQGAAKQTAVVE